MHLWPGNRKRFIVSQLSGSRRSGVAVLGESELTAVYSHSCRTRVNYNNIITNEHAGRALADKHGRKPCNSRRPRRREVFRPLRVMTTTIYTRNTIRHNNNTRTRRILQTIRVTRNDYIIITLFSRVRNSARHFRRTCAAAVTVLYRYI